jgi:hypothetical protein
LNVILLVVSEGDGHSHSEIIDASNVVANAADPKMPSSSSLRDATIEQARLCDWWPEEAGDEELVIASLAVFVGTAHFP